MLASGAPSRDGIADNRSVAAIGSAAYRNAPSIAASCTRPVCTRPASNGRSACGQRLSFLNIFAEHCDRAGRICKDGFIRRDKPKGCAGPDGCAGLGALVVAPEHHDIPLAGTSAGRDTNASCAHTLLGLRREGELLLRHHPQP